MIDWFDIILSEHLILKEKIFRKFRGTIWSTRRYDEREIAVVLNSKGKKNRFFLFGSVQYSLCSCDRHLLLLIVYWYWYTSGDVSEKKSINTTMKRMRLICLEFFSRFKPRISNFEHRNLWKHGISHPFVCLHFKSIMICCVWRFIVLACPNIKDKENSITSKRKTNNVHRTYKMKQRQKRHT